MWFAMWLLCGYYLVAMWFLCSWNTVAMRLLCGCYAVAMQFFWDCYAVAMLLPCGCYSVAMWLLCGWYVVDMRLLWGWYAVAMRLLCGSCQVAISAWQMSFFWQINIRIYMWHQNLVICRTEYICLGIIELSNIFKYLLCKKKIIYEYIYGPQNIPNIFLNEYINQEIFNYSSIL